MNQHQGTAGRQHRRSSPIKVTSTTEMKVIHINQPNIYRPVFPSCKDRRTPEGCRSGNQTYTPLFVFVCLSFMITGEGDRSRTSVHRRRGQG